MAKHVVWFRQDLRVSDNTALWRACEDPKAEVVGVFCATPQQWAEHDMAPIRQQFIRRNLVTCNERSGTSIFRLWCWRVAIMPMPILKC